ncbi:hypothetical protein BDF20DRAFT_834593 [Mycotypha africana]|uniref:uncharacterized protein n=1 Tax=Mycotypha africana TaxID=64632 RepID=UPI0023015032|nr:uncharacterized protein BDF20DRAFT_834593 [Mycotypha africana]KAI8981926.1 hypothetical protein BDF20DRAFT_834593 [Mycotypha africana]
MSRLPSSFPPVLIQVQNTIDEQLLQRLISYSLNVVKTYHALPVILVLLQLACFWISKRSPSKNHETIPDTDHYAKPINSLLALSLFLSENHTNKIFQSAVETICSTNKRFFESILDKVNSKEPLNKIRRICEKGILYNDEVKAKIVDNSASSQSSDKLDFPEPLPMGPQTKRTHTMVDEDIEFVESFKKEQIGRMNWQSCLKAGHSRKLLESYTTRKAYESRRLLTFTLTFTFNLRTTLRYFSRAYM